MSGCVSSGFILMSLKSVMSWSLPELLHTLSSGVNLLNFKSELLSLPSLADSQTWVSSFTRSRRFDLGIATLPHSMSKYQGWSYHRANLGFWVFWFISLLLAVSIFNLPPFNSIILLRNILNMKSIKSS